MARRKCPYTYPHRSRKAKADFICGIGGYSDRHERWPIEFTVGLYHANLDFDNLWTVMIRQKLLEFPKAEFDLWRQEAEKVYEQYKDGLWQRGQESMCDSLENDDGIRSLWDGRILDIELSLRGRCGKHLVIDKFEGITLAGYTDTSLHEAIMLQYAPDRSIVDKDRLVRGGKWDIPDEWVDKLYRYCRQAVIDFTSQKASRELEFQAAFVLSYHIDEAVAERKKQLRETRRLEDHAKLLYQRMQKDGETIDALYALCLAAGVVPSELAVG